MLFRSFQYNFLGEVMFQGMIEREFIHEIDLRTSALQEQPAVRCKLRALLHPSMYVMKINHKKTFLNSNTHPIVLFLNLTTYWVLAVLFELFEQVLSSVRSSTNLCIERVCMWKKICVCICGKVDENLLIIQSNKSRQASQRISWITFVNLNMLKLLFAVNSKEHNMHDLSFGLFCPVVL